MQFVPLNSFVVVKKIPSSSTSSGGIILQSSQGVDKCTVLAKPESIRQVDVGDTLLIRWSAALQVDDLTYVVDVKDIVTKVF